jgi:DNA-binding CsgD family transcriptional regulator
MDDLGSNRNFNLKRVKNQSVNPVVLQLLLQLIANIENALNEFPPKRGSGTTGDGEVLLTVHLGSLRYALFRAEQNQSPAKLPFSARVIEVIRLVCKRLPNKAIASIIEISPWTAATYLRRLFIKLGVSTRAEMITTILNEDLASKKRDDKEDTTITQPLFCKFGSKVSIDL